MQTKETSFLRTVLRLDAATCVLSGGACLAGTSFLGGALGLSTGLLQGAGVVLLLVGAFMLFAAQGTPALRWPVWIVVLGNAAWVLASALLLISGVQQPTAAGTIVVLAQAIGVAVLAELEYIGLRKIGATSQVALRS